MQATVRVEGLDRLVRDFGRMSKQLRKDLQAELKDIAGHVADEAQSVAEREGLRDSGKLIRSIKPSVRGSTAYVRATATNRGFNYPRRHEFENGGVRAFLHPALQQSTSKVEREIGRMVDRLADRNGF